MYVCRVFVLQGRHEHEAYTGDRTKESLVAFADSLVPSAGQPHLKHGQLKAAPRTPGCNVAGMQCCAACGGKPRHVTLAATHMLSLQTVDIRAVLREQRCRSTVNARGILYPLASTIHACCVLCWFAQLPTLWVLCVCAAGFVLVKKVPGTLHFTARAEGHSFDHAW